MDGVRTPVVRDGVNLPKPSKAVDQKTRTFTKRMTVASIIGLFALAFYGVSVGYERTPEAIGELGPWIVGLMFIYAMVGHWDFKLLLGKPFFVDIVTSLLSRGGRRHRAPGEGE